MKQPCLYIMANERNGTIYIGVTSYLPRRDFEHKNKVFEGFAKRYGCNKLIYYEFHDTMEGVITREKQMKKWNRKWKLELIDKFNPNWDDLSQSLI